MRLIAYSIQVPFTNPDAAKVRAGKIFPEAVVKEVHNIESGTCCMFRSDAVISER